MPTVMSTLTHERSEVQSPSETWVVLAEASFNPPALESRSAADFDLMARYEQLAVGYERHPVHEDSRGGLQGEITPL